MNLYGLRVILSAALLASWGLTMFCSKAADIPGLLLTSGAAVRPRVSLSSPSELTPTVPADVPIFAEFNVFMEEESARRAFILTGTSPSTGTFSWEGKRLNYILNQNLTPGNSFLLQISSTAKSKDGYTMDVDYLVHFVVGSRVDAPAVLAATPGDGQQNVDPSSVIRLVFSRSMDRASVENAFQISPSAPGDFTWDTDSRGFTYTPRSPLSFAALYTAVLSTGAKDMEGISISDSFRMTFQAGIDFTRPFVTAVYESGSAAALTDGQTGIYKDSSFIVNFSEQMQYSRTENSFSLVKLLDGSTVTGAINFTPSFASLLFDPAAALEPDCAYRLTVSASAGDIAGNTLQNPLTLDFTVNNSAGAVNSDYLAVGRIEEIDGVNPPDLIAIGSDVSIVTVNPLFSTTNVRIAVVLNHSLSRGSAMENFSLTKVLGTNVGSSSRQGISFGSEGSLVDNVLYLDFADLGYNNVYRLILFGGRNALKSKSSGSETGTWMSGDTTVYFSIQP